MFRMEDRLFGPDAVIPMTMMSLKSWGKIPETAGKSMKRDAAVDCGWGRLLFGQTYGDPAELARDLEGEADGRRDVAFYAREPHVVLSHAPLNLFLDPSHAFRLDLRDDDLPSSPIGLTVRIATAGDQEEVNRIYRSRGMVPLKDGYCGAPDAHEAVDVLVAVDEAAGRVAGVVMAVDHVGAFRDPDNGSSLWSLAVDPQAPRPGVGELLVVAVAKRMRERGRVFLDLSVMHDNDSAIALYQKLGFVQVPVFCLKRKNPINEKLFVGPDPEERLNVYARIVVDEARRRGIAVTIDDAEAGMFTLEMGGRTISCRESLSELTSAVAMSRCDDKALTRRILKRAGLRVPDQIIVGDESEARAFLDRHGRVVVKPARGEQGRGVQVDLRVWDDVAGAIEHARANCDTVVMEQYVSGRDLRIIVIDGEVVAAATRLPARIIGDGKRTVAELIEKQSRRRAAATDGESRIPMDGETERCVADAGHAMTDVLRAGTELVVRKTANLHTGGTIHDVTADLSPTLAEAAVAGARAIGIPLTGFDFLVPDVAGDDYVIIEANERPGLANHEPQPTAERFIDMLFPQTRNGRDRR